jgi:hypothetical protein
LGELPIILWWQLLAGYRHGRVWRENWA